MMSQNENIADLLELIQQYPDLPVIPVIIPDSFEDYENYVPGKIGRVYVDEYMTFEMSRLYYFYLKSDKMFDDVLYDYFEHSNVDDLKNEGADIEQIYNALPWKKAIIAEIDDPCL